MVDRAQQPLGLPEAQQVRSADLPAVLAFEEHAAVDEEDAEEARVLFVAAAQERSDALRGLLADTAGGDALRRGALEVSGEGQQIPSERFEGLAAAAGPYSAAGPFSRRRLGSWALGGADHRRIRRFPSADPPRHPYPRERAGSRRGSRTDTLAR